MNGRVGVTVLTTVRLSVRSRSKVTHSARFQCIRIAGGQRKRFVDRMIRIALALDARTAFYLQRTAERSPEYEVMTIAQLKDPTRQPLCFGIRSVLDLQRARNAVVLNQRLKQVQLTPLCVRTGLDRCCSWLALCGAIFHRRWAWPAWGDT